MTSSAQYTTYDVKKQKGLIQHMQKYPLYNQLHQQTVIPHFISISMIRDYTLAWDVVKPFSHFVRVGTPPVQLDTDWICDHQSWKFKIEGKKTTALSEGMSEWEAFLKFEDYVCGFSDQTSMLTTIEYFILCVSVHMCMVFGQLAALAQDPCNHSWRYCNQHICNFTR